MKYLLAIYGDESAQAETPPEALDAYMQGWFKYDEDLRKSATVLAGNGLHPTSTATTVRMRDGKVVSFDGPFAETKEQLGGFYLIDVPDLDKAIEAASKMPNLPFGGSVEVRPVQVFED